jgi:plastocyanin
MFRPHRSLTAPPAAAVATAAFPLVSGCSGSSPAPQGPPSINFGSRAGSTPGTPGHSAAGPTPVTSVDTTSPTVAPAAVSGPAVSITNFTFTPATLTVPVGATVTWTNHDEEPPTVAANDASFHSPGLGTNSLYSVMFPTAGRFDYICSIHPFMHGTVVVTK